MTSEGLGVSTDDLLVGLHDSTNFGSLKKQLKQIERTEQVQELLPAVVSREERKQHYAETVDSLNKTNRQVAFHRRSEHIDFVQEELEGKVASLTPSVAALAASYNPRSELERELYASMSRFAPKEEKNDFTDPKVKQATEQRQLARLRTLLHAELQRNRRIKKIKSKTFRKAHRQGENKEKEKLLTRLESENPELAQKLRDEFERKLAKLRLQRHKTARQKWAKVAQRFGGKAMASEIGRQAQIESDEKKELIRAVKGKRKRTDDPSGDESGDESDDSGVSDSEDLIESTRRKVKQLQESENQQLPTDGLLGMGFMRKGIERKRREADDEAANLLNELDNLNQSSNSLEQQEFTPAALEKATAEIASLLDPQTMEISTQNNNPWLSATGLAVTEAAKPKKSKKAKKAKTEKVQKNPPPEEEISDSDTDLLNRFGGAELDEGQRALVKELFAQGGTHANVFEQELNNVDKEKKNVSDGGSLPGWGNWAGPGIIRRSRRSKTTKSAVQKSMAHKPAIKIVNVNPSKGKNPKKSEKKESGKNLFKQPTAAPVATGKSVISRAIVSDAVKSSVNPKVLPYPFKNQADFDAIQNSHTAPELMTLSAHKRIVAPRVNVRVGAVIQPLDTGKQLSMNERDSLIDAWNNRRKPTRTKAKF